MEKKNILFLTRTYALGGAQTIILQLIRNLPRDRFNILTLPYEASGEGDRDFIAAVRSQGDDVIPERLVWNKQRSMFKVWGDLQQIIRNYRIDLLHTHDNLSNFIVGLGHRRWSCPTVASAYGWWEPKWNLKIRTYYYLERRLALPRFDRVYTVSQNMKRKVVRGGAAEERVKVIHTGIEQVDNSSLPSAEETRTVLGIPADAVVVGTVSRLSPEKGHAHLLRAASRLLENFPSLYLLILGTGPSAPELKDLSARLGVSHRMHFTGYYENLAQALSAMDIFALPSILDEGFPTAVVEAEAAGLPIVASDIGGTRETLVEGETGLLVPPGDETALSEALATLLADTAKRSQMGRNARELVERRFTQPGMLIHMSDLYLEAMDSHDRPG